MTPGPPRARSRSGPWGPRARRCRLAEEFTAENPDITVNVDPLAWDVAHDRLITSVAGGEGPDVSQMGTTWMGEFASIGASAPVPDDVDLDAFYEGASDTAIVDEHRLRRALVRRDPRPLLPDRPRRGGRHHRASRHMGRTQGGRASHAAGRGSMGDRPVTQQLAGAAALLLAAGRRRGRPTTASPTSTPTRWSRPSSSTSRSSTRV